MSIRRENGPWFLILSATTDRSHAACAKSMQSTGWVLALKGKSHLLRARGPGEVQSRDKGKKSSGGRRNPASSSPNQQKEACCMCTCDHACCNVPQRKKKQARHDRCAVRHRQPIFLYVARVSPTLSFWNGSIDAVHMEGTDREDVSA